MAFITYVLLDGYTKGTSNIFTPELLIRSIWICMAFQVVEVIIFKLGLNSMQVSLPFLDLFSYTGYKYVGLCATTISLILGRSAFFLISLYNAAAIAFFVLKSLAAAIPANSVSPSGPPRHVVLLGFAIVQFVVVCILSWF
jgi:hypothetical protein